MPKNYVYRIDHDIGFAPHIYLRRTCTLCGCKMTTIERWAEPNSWIIGVSGKNAGEADRVIYAMEVEEALPLGELRRRSPCLVAYLRKSPPSSRVLVSQHFYYLGNNAISLPASLQHILIHAQGCKKVSDEDVTRLLAHLAQRFSPGERGTPNNRQPQMRCTSRCRRGEDRLGQAVAKQGAGLAGCSNRRSRGHS